MIHIRPRLRAIAALIEPGTGTVLDIGTDHAQLPVYLIQTGRAEKVIASDIASGPLSRAAETVDQHGAQDRVVLHLGDGLDGLEKSGADAIVIAGMGGEMILHILEKAPFVRQNGCLLLLQPMTRAEVLRKWLGENGFSVLREELVEDEKLYQILMVRWDGIRRTLSPYQCVVGQNPPNGALWRKQAERLLAVYSVRLRGKQEAGLPTAEEEAICRALKAAIEEELHDSH